MDIETRGLHAVSAAWMAAMLLVAASILPARDAVAQPAPAAMHIRALEDGRYEVMARGASLEHALQELVTVTQLSLLYDPALVRDIETYCVKDATDAEGVLRCLIEPTRLDFYRLSSGTYVLREAVLERPRYGQLAGIVIDSETGEPLPYASVVLADAATGTATNESGMFSFAALLPGRHAISATYVGYQPVLDSIFVPAGGEARSFIYMKPKTIVSDPIVVNGLQQRLPSRTIGMGEANPASLEAIGGLSSDVTRAINQILGVALRSPLADLHIQGGEASEHQMQLDGVPVFSPVALGRFLGAFSPLSIGRLSVQKAGFGARYGSQLSGVIQAEHRLDGSADAFLTASVDPLSLNVRGDGALRFSSRVKGPFMVAVRESLWDVYSAPTLNQIMDEWNAVDPGLTQQFLKQPYGSSTYAPRTQAPSISFSDLHLATRLETGPFSRLYVSGYRGANALSTDLVADVRSTIDAATSPHLLLTRDRYDWSNSNGQLRYEWIANARLLAGVRVRGSRHTMSHDYGLVDEQLIGASGIEALQDSLTEGGLSRDRNEISEAGFGGTLEYSLSSTDHIEGGLEAIYRSNAIRLNTPFFQQTNALAESWLIAGYLEHRRSIGMHMQADFGLRGSYLPDQSTAFFEPRVALRYDVAAAGGAVYAARLAAGVYRQFVGEFDLSSVGPTALAPSVRFWYPVDETLPLPRAYHLAGEFLWAPVDALRMRLELYHKWQPVLLAINYPTLLGLGPPIPENARHAHFIEPVSGRAYGAGMHLEWEGTRFLHELSYSYSASYRTYPSRFGGEEVTSPWNEPHRLTLASDRFIGSDLSVRARWQGVWGRQWGFRRAYYDWLNAHAGSRAFPPYDLSQPDAPDHRLPAHLQLDLGMTYARSVGTARVQVSVDVINVLNRDNVVDWSLTRVSETRYERVPRLMPSVTPVFSLKVSL
ncbi:MAG: TonB-dependent receptor [Rhodothermales bacterium]